MNRRKQSPLLLAGLCLCATTCIALSVTVAATAATGTTTLVSLDSSGRQANDASWSPMTSDDGCVVAFKSDASNLVPDDTNGLPDVFLHDCRSRLTTRLSVSSSGEQANGWTYGFDLSADGRVVAFASDAANLVPNDTNGRTDIFVHDTGTGITSRVSVAASGAEGNSGADSPALSADGRFVAFESWASNLVPDDANGQPDIFVHDRQTGVVTLVSLDSSGTQADDRSYAPAISADGRFVAFQSYASNLVAADSNDASDIFVHDRHTGTTTRVSVDSSGAQANEDSFEPDLSADGRFVAFHAWASNLVAGDTAICEDHWGPRNCVDVFVHDCQTGATTRVSVDSVDGQGNSDSGGAAVSADGRFVAFSSSASNLVLDDTNEVADAFVYDRQLRVVVRVSVNSNGWQASGPSGMVALSADGRFAVFASRANDLVPSDENEVEDIFVRDLGEPPQQIFMPAIGRGS